jgi:hypothetical protein
MKLGFNIGIILLSLAVAAAIAGLKYGLGFYSGENHIWFAWLFFILLTWASYKWTLSAKPETNRFFTSRFFSSMGLRLFFCLIFLVIYLISNPQHDPVFVLSFMMLYLFYTMFEIYFLVYKLRREN